MAQKRKYGISGNENMMLRELKLRGYEREGKKIARNIGNYQILLVLECHGHHSPCPQYLIIPIQGIVVSFGSES